MGDRDEKAEEIKRRDNDGETAQKKKTRKKRPDHAGVSSHDHISGTGKENVDQSRKRKQENRDIIKKDKIEEMAMNKEEQMEKKSTKKRKRKGRKNKKNQKIKKIIAITSGSILGVLVLVYAGFAIYFNSHFLFFTQINGTDFSFKDVDQVEAYMKKHVSDYTLTLEESGGGKETINGSDISIEYVPGKHLENIMEEQDNILWIKSLWEHPEIETEIGVKYNEEAMASTLANLKCMNPENQTASVDARPEFQEGQFVVTPEVVGTQIDAETFSGKVAEAISSFQPTLDIAEAGCYIPPRFVSDSPEVVAAKDAMNSYLGANITYDFNPYTEVVDASVISQWISVDAEMNVAFNEDAVRGYVQALADKYNTKGRTRTFTTATGNAVTIEGGSYGWLIDQEAEYNALIGNIQNAETVTREPNYASRAASHEGNDVGGTYAEVDLSTQHMYFIQNGQVVLDTAIVTGNPNKGNATPQGVYSLAYKALDQTLRGTKKPDGTYEYETPVKFWMPFNGGIGFHDATWQSSFGGNRYLTKGSHGCVNMPYSAAEQLYSLISAGTPVVCHF